MHLYQFPTGPREAQDFPFAHMNLGVLMRKLGKPKEAIARLDHVLSLQPNYADAHWNLSLALLYSGDFARGWNEYEWRFRRNGSKPSDRSPVQVLAFNFANKINASRGFESGKCGGGGKRADAFTFAFVCCTAAQA